MTLANFQSDGNLQLRKEYVNRILRGKHIVINDSNREPPNVVPRTHAILSNIDVNIQDVKDILQTLQIGKACGGDGISHQMLKATSETICLGILYEPVNFHLTNRCNRAKILVKKIGLCLVFIY
jgi:hypothetical protein